MSHILASSWNDPPGKICWLHVGKNSRASSGEVKTGLLRDASTGRMQSAASGESSRGCGGGSLLLAG